MMNRHKKPTSIIKKILLIILLDFVVLNILKSMVTYNNISLNTQFEDTAFNPEYSTTNTDTSTTYLSLEEDPNAEDAIKVYKTTEGLIKGELKYPVRKDNKKVVYLTFDDGPSIENTENILKVLDNYNIKATFFLTGVSINKGDTEKDLVKKIACNGHAIGNHSYSHSYKKLYPNRYIDREAFFDDIKKNDALLKSILGPSFSTRAIRFPGGYWSWKNRKEIKDEIDNEGYAIIDWNSLNEDAQGSFKYAPELVAMTKKNVNNLGENADSIVFLMHDANGKAETVKALPEIIEFFKSNNFEFKTIK